MAAGVYAITAPSGKQYIGSSVNMPRRWPVHRHHLRRGTHHTSRLQASANKYGVEALTFSVLIVCSESDVRMYEQLAIDALKPAYNVLSVAGSSSGFRHTPETKAKMSAIHKGKTLSAEHRAQTIRPLHMARARRVADHVVMRVEGEAHVAILA